MTCRFQKYTLQFKRPGGTSRGVLLAKDTYFLILQDDTRRAFGECNRFSGLSYDDRPDYEKKLEEICMRLPEEGESVLASLADWPSIAFGVEMLLRDWAHGGRRVLFPEVIGADGFCIPTNALIWMGEPEMMKAQIQQKLAEGYRSIKLKVGAIDFEAECALLAYIREQFGPETVEIRLDANGAFDAEEALEKIKRLSEYAISYIEQPIKAGQWEAMAALVRETPIPIALDEELIGMVGEGAQQAMIDAIAPQMLILKPALIGGFAAADRWKKRVEAIGGTWVITSALESNIGLNAIAQYTALGWSEFPQGLGTGRLFTNNFPSPYTVDAAGLQYHPDNQWDLSNL